MSATTIDRGHAAVKTTYTVLFAISFCHLLNDMMQSLLPALYPILKSNYGLSFAQIGLMTFTYYFWDAPGRVRFLFETIERKK